MARTPKRTEERHRTRAEQAQVERVQAEGTVEPPELALEDFGIEPHPLTVDLWHSLRSSGQARSYEPSDWQATRIGLLAVDAFVRKSVDYGTFSPNQFAEIRRFVTDLMLTEGARRRLRLEIERADADPAVQDAKTERMNAYRNVASIA